MSVQSCAAERASRVTKTRRETRLLAEKARAPPASREAAATFASSTRRPSDLSLPPSNLPPLCLLLYSAYRPAQDPPLDASQSSFLARPFIRHAGRARKPADAAGLQRRRRLRRRERFVLDHWLLEPVLELLRAARTSSSKAVNVLGVQMVGSRLTLPLRLPPCLPPSRRVLAQPASFVLALQPSHSQNIFLPHPVCQGAPCPPGCPRCRCQWRRRGRG